VALVLRARDPLTPSTRAPIPVFRSLLSAEAMARAGEVMASGWLGQGAQVKAFENELAARLNARHCVAVSSGTAALHLALAVLDLPPGSEVVTTAMTWIASHHAIEYAGCRPVLADVDPATGNIAPASVEACIGERTSAVLIVHYSGYPCDLTALRGIADLHGLPLIEDAAHAFGATYGGAAIGSAPNLQAFSFGPTKNLTTIFGGAITVDDDAQAQRLRALRGLGLNRNVSDAVLEGRPSYRDCYQLHEIGFRYEMADVHAAVGLGQLAVVDEEDRRRHAIADVYARELTGIGGIELLERRPDRQSANYFFPVLVEAREDLAAALRTRGVEVSVHYPLNPLLSPDRSTILKAESFAAQTLTLPLHPSLTDDELTRVIDGVRSGW